MTKRAPLFGLSFTPETSAVADIRELARLGDELGFDLLGIQDHPYQARFVDTMALLSIILAETKQLRVFPDVANLPLRPPAMLAKMAATLDLLNDGRFELGLGGGGFWDAIVAFGGPRRTPGESVEALEEAIQVIRHVWSGDRGVRFDGEYYELRGAHTGPRPAHDIGIWLGAYGPRMLRLVGRQADGWLPSFFNATFDFLRDGNARIDAAAEKAGRDPASVLRLLNVGGMVTDGGTPPIDEKRISGPSDFWIDRLGQLREMGFDAFIYWPEADFSEQVHRFAADVAPALRG